MISHRWLLTVVATSLWLSLLVPGRAQADVTPVVVLGNLGSSGSGAISNESVTTGAGAEFRVAQGFRTGTSVSSSFLMSVTLGLATLDGSGGSRTVQIWTNGTNNMPSSVLYTSSPVTVSGQGLYTFSLPWKELSPSTTYWVVPSTPSVWYFTDDGDTPNPVAQNGSDWTFPGTRRQNETTLDWSNRGQLNPLSVSIVAVPEPQTLTVATIGLVTGGAVGFMRHRRRRRHAHSALVA